MTRPRLSSLASLVALALACTSHSPARPDKPATVDPEPAAADAETPTDTPQPEAAAPPALPAAPAFAAGPFEVRGRGKRKPEPPSLTFTDLGGENQDHVWASGWTADGSAFAYCEKSAGADDCEPCTFTRLDGTTEKWTGGRGCAKGPTRLKSRKELKAKLAELGVQVRDGTWAHGGELIVTERMITGAPRKDNDAPGILKIGAARRDGSGGGEAFEHVACVPWTEETKNFCLFEAHADMIVPSPDGATIAILEHMFAGEWSDTFLVHFVPPGRLAAAAYNQQGLDALKAKDHAAAATAFVTAMAADPQAWKHPYNLACAYAQAGDPRAETALKTALERDGETVRNKAAADKDLDPVRNRPWFTALLAPGK